MAKKRSKFNFGDKVDKVIEHEENRSQGFGYIKLPKGVELFEDNKDQDLIDIIPYIVTDENHRDIDNMGVEVGEPWYRKPFFVHRDIGPNEETIVCPSTIGEKCPICEYRNSLKKQGKEYDEIKEFNAKLRYLYVVIPINNEEFEEDFHIWDESHYLFEKKLIDDIKKGNVDKEFASPENGQTLKVRWIEREFGKNKFGDAGAIDGMKRDPYDDGIIEEAPNLDECLIIHSYKKLEKMFMDLDDEDIVEEEMDKAIEEKPVSRRKDVTNRRGRKEKEESTEESTEEKPKGRGRGAKSRRNAEPDPDQDNKCPHGYEFGKDTEQYEECETCKVYDDCLDANKDR